MYWRTRAERAEATWLRARNRLALLRHKFDEHGGSAAPVEQAVRAEARAKARYDELMRRASAAWESDT